MMIYRDGDPCPECKSGRLVAGILSRWSVRAPVDFKPSTEPYFKSPRPLFAYACQECGFVKLRLN